MGISGLLLYERPGYMNRLISQQVRINGAPLYLIRWHSNTYVVFACPKSIFLSQTCFLQQYTFVQTCVKCRGVYLNEENGSYVIRQNNIKQLQNNIKMLRAYYFLIKRKKLFGQPNISYNRTLFTQIDPATKYFE